MTFQNAFHPSLLLLRSRLSTTDVALQNYGRDPTDCLTWTPLVRLQPRMVILTQILFYDHALTLNDEVRPVWVAKATLPKFLFLINRYFVPIAMIFKITGNKFLLHSIPVSHNSTSKILAGWLSLSYLIM